MKIKQLTYFALIAIGASIMAFGKLYILEEYALAIGIVFLMFGIYKMSTSWKNTEEDSKEV
ncbi:hypothetical protein H0I23_02485 [Cellulophaga sp. HaHaR_3_176]|uniref:hypothetical protein n=1 Tax=Cellulophaga sp. HaHaR_3_176 TaxID=1942464 RepID=UPI001C1F208C|nr:hypothetical protein [Cellulophaga sp. HaHaR_3_176]QWX84532.1 hypothetical protein H0I23_02485 [Cellulophaga sp. HaHaR_3_176]